MGRQRKGTSSSSQVRAQPPTWVHWCAECTVLTCYTSLFWSRECRVRSQPLRPEPSQIRLRNQPCSRRFGWRLRSRARRFVTTRRHSTAGVIARPRRSQTTTSSRLDRVQQRKPHSPDFKRKFQTDLPLDTGEELTLFAREMLRQKFLNADAGISGANFVTADTGSIVLVESEGNIRLTSQLPPLHIAITGIEKVLPKRED